MGADGGCGTHVTHGIDLKPVSLNVRVIALLTVLTASLEKPYPDFKCFIMLTNHTLTERVNDN